MNFMSSFGRPGIHEGLKEYESSPNGVLMDVRTPQEYASGHIPGSVNIPLSNLAEAARKYPNPNTPLFVYCQSGARSGQAASYLSKMGYHHVKNIGGISSYQGPLA